MDDDHLSKFAIALAMALVSFVSAAAPMRVIQVDAHLFSVGNLLASGILLAAGLVHQLPDSIQKLNRSLPSTRFPVGPFVSGLTFCAFLILEEYLHTQFSDRHFPATQTNKEEGKEDGWPNQNDDQRNHQHPTNCFQNQESPFFRAENAPLLLKPPILLPACYETKEESNDRSASSYHSYTDIETGWCTASHCRHESFTVVEHPKHSPHNTMLQSFQSKTFASEHQHHHHQEHVAQHMHGSLVSSIILLCALSIHSILEGVAIGISSSQAEVFSTTMAVMSHKAFASYALGSSMVASQMNERHFFVLVSVFSLCGVLGIMLGMMFDQWSQNNKDSVTMGIVQAMVAGTFLYVSIVEIGLKEILLCRDSPVLLGDKMSRRDMEWSKLVAFLVGYLSMSSLSVII